MSIIRLLLKAYGNDILIIVSLIAIAFYIGFIIHTVIASIRHQHNILSLDLRCESCGAQYRLIECLPIGHVVGSFLKCRTCHVSKPKMALFTGLVLSLLFIYARYVFPWNFGLIFVLSQIALIVFFLIYACTIKKTPYLALVSYAFLGIASILYGHVHVFLYDTRSYMIQFLFAIILMMIGALIGRFILKRTINPMDPLFLALSTLFLGLPAVIAAIFFGLLMKTITMIVFILIRCRHVEERISMTSYLAIAMLFALFYGRDFVRMFINTFI